MKCLDSTFIVDFLKGDKDAVSKVRELEFERLCSTIVNLIEIAVGIYRKKDINHEVHLDKVKNLFNKFYLLNFNYESAISSARINSDLVNKGEQIDANDCSIAAIMLANGCDTIITRNKEHFQRIKGIK